MNTDTTTTLTRDDACRLGDAHGWNTQDSDGPVVYAWMNNRRVTIIYPADNPYESAPESVRVSYRCTNDTWQDATLPGTDARWALETFGLDPLPPYTEWALEHGYRPYAPYEGGDVRLQWHYQTGTEDAEYWGTVPESWGEFNAWRSRAAR